MLLQPRRHSPVLAWHTHRQPRRRLGPHSLCRRCALQPRATSAYRSTADTGCVWAVGDNTYGQLGLGRSVTSTATPSPCMHSTARSVAAGLRHSVALLQDGRVMAWGANRKTQCGVEVRLCVLLYVCTYIGVDNHHLCRPTRPVCGSQRMYTRCRNHAPPSPPGAITAPPFPTAASGTGAGPSTPPLGTPPHSH